MRRGVVPFARAVARPRHDHDPAGRQHGAPTGTSPRSAAARASERAMSMWLVKRMPPHAARSVLSQARALR